MTAEDELRKIRETMEEMRKIPAVQDELRRIRELAERVADKLFAEGFKVPGGPIQDPSTFKVLEKPIWSGKGGSESAGERDSESVRPAAAVQNQPSVTSAPANPAAASTDTQGATPPAAAGTFFSFGPCVVCKKEVMLSWQPTQRTWGRKMCQDCFRRSRQAGAGPVGSVPTGRQY